MIKLFEEYEQMLTEGKLWDQFPPIVDPVECKKKYDSISWDSTPEDIVSQLCRVCKELKPESGEPNACVYEGPQMCLRVEVDDRGNNKRSVDIGLGRGSRFEFGKYHTIDYTTEAKFKNTIAGLFNVIEHIKNKNIGDDFNLRNTDLLLNTYRANYKG